MASEAKLAAELLFCLDRLKDFETERPEYAWLWKIRLKIVAFMVGRYALREAKGDFELTDEEKVRILKSERLLRAASRKGPAFESKEVEKVRADLRKRLEPFADRNGDT